MTLTRQEWERQLPGLRGRLLRYVQMHVADSHAAEDILQDTLAEADAHLDSLRDGDRVASWLKTIAFYKISLHFRGRKWHSWSDLHDAVAAAPESARDLLDTFDNMIRMLHGVEGSLAERLAVVLRYCMDWSPRQIAAVTRIKPNTVHARIRRAKRMLSRGADAADVPPEEDIRLKIELGRALLEAGANPMEGGLFRKREWMREGWNVLKLSARQYPGNAQMLYNLLRATFWMLEVSEYPDDTTPGRFEHEWRREARDPALRAQAQELFQALLRLQPPRVVELEAWVQYELHMPLRHADVDWRKIRDLLLERNSYELLPTNFYMLARCEYHLHGPARALTLWESVKSNAALRNWPGTMAQMGQCAMEARQWKKAVRYFRQFLKWPLNESLKAMVEDTIQQCRKNSSGGVK